MVVWKGELLVGWWEYQLAVQLEIMQVVCQEILQVAWMVGKLENETVGQQAVWKVVQLAVEKEPSMVKRAVEAMDYKLVVLQAVQLEQSMAEEMVSNQDKSSDFSLVVLQGMKLVELLD